MMADNLHENPKELEKVRKEVLQLYPSANPVEIKVERINQLEQMRLVMRETLRYNSPVFGNMLREADSDHILAIFLLRKAMWWQLFGVKRISI